MEYLALVIPIILTFLFQMIVPYKPSGKFSTIDFDRNKSKYDKLEFLSIFYIFLSVISVGLSVYYIGSQMSEYASSSYKYIMKPPSVFWGLLGVVLGFGLVRIPMYVIYRLILGKEYELYMEYTNKKHGWNGEKVWRPIESILSFVGITLFLLGLNWHVYIKDQTITFNDLFSLKTRTYNLSEISEIRHCADSVSINGYTKNKEYYVVKMRDGYEWNSKIYSFFTDVEEDYVKIGNNMRQLSKFSNLEMKECDI